MRRHLQLRIVIMNIIVLLLFLLSAAEISLRERFVGVNQKATEEGQERMVGRVGKKAIRRVVVRRSRIPEAS